MGSLVFLPTPARQLVKSCPILFEKDRFVTRDVPRDEFQIESNLKSNAN